MSVGCSGCGTFSTGIAGGMLAGDELTRELMRINPETPVILCTGYSSRINQKQARALGVRAFVSKPVLKREIAETIRKVLDGK